VSNDKYITLSFLIAAVLIGALLRSFGIEVIAALAWPDPLVMGLLNATSLAGIVTGVVSFLVLLRNATAVRFVDECVVEVRKTFFPGREETMDSTVVVIVATFIMSGSLALFDFFWAKVTAVVFALV